MFSWSDDMELLLLDAELVSEVRLVGLQFSPLKIRWILKLISDNF